MARMSAYCVSAIIAASLLLSCAGMHHPPTTISQEPIFECTNVVGAEPFDTLVKRVVSVAENQAFLTSQSVPSDVFPTSVLPSGHWETQKPGTGSGVCFSASVTPNGLPEHCMQVPVHAAHAATAACVSRLPDSPKIWR